MKREGRRERRWQRQSLGRNDGSDQRYERLFCFESIHFEEEERLPSLLSFVLSSLTKSFSLLYIK